jgi:ketosteroid isomerase-like protein
MKKLTLVLLLTLGCVSLAHAQQPTASPSPAPKPAMSKAQSQKMIIATEQKLWNAWKNKDVKVFRANLTADSVLVNENGVATKATILEQMGGSTCEVKSFELNEIKVAFVAGNAAIVTYKASQDGTCGGQALPAAVWASSTYVMRGGRWLAASHQETAAK